MSKQKGDTIVEVMVSFAIFSMLAVGGLSLMNQGTATAQRTLEITLVRQQIDAQADILRTINREVVSGRANDGFKETWEGIIAKAVSVNAGAPDFVNFDAISDSQKCKKPPDVDSKAFVINPFMVEDYDGSYNSPIVTSFKPANTYAQIQTTGTSIEPQGLWVIAVDGGLESNYYDFHIRTCWISPGQGAPMKLGTIVRLYYAS